MAKITSKKSSNKGIYLFFFFTIIIFTSLFIYLDLSSVANFNKMPNKKLENKSLQYEKPLSEPSYSINKKEVTKDYCSLSRRETSNYIIKNSPFNFDSSGTVSFFSSSRISIYGNGKTLYGTWTVSSNNKVRINDLRVVSGNFDATNNHGANGYLFINCNGSLSGNLYDRNRNTISLNLKTSN